MTKVVATLLGPSTNYAVVQMPDRQFPGVVFQGDGLAALMGQIQQMQAQLRAEDFVELAHELEALEEHIRAIKSQYETVCLEQGIALPYSN